MIKSRPYSLKNTIPVKVVYWLDKHSNVLHNMEMKRAEWLLKEFPINSWISDANKILDIGCGMGYVDNKLKILLNSNIYGFDIIDFRTRFVKQNTLFKYFRGDVYKIPTREASFDSVLILVSLHHLWHPEEAIKEAIRVLKPGGSLIILEDIIKSRYSLQTLLTFFVDTVINLTFTKNPYTNKSKNQWIHLFTEKFQLELVRDYSIKWGGLFKNLELGVFWLKKDNN